MKIGLVHCYSGAWHDRNIVKCQNKPGIDYVSNSVFITPNCLWLVLNTVELKKEELEAFRLRYVEGLDQRECAAKMDISPATLQRILFSAQQKIAIALVKGQAIKIGN